MVPSRSIATTRGERRPEGARDEPGRAWELVEGNLGMRARRPRWPRHQAGGEGVVSWVWGPPGARWRWFGASWESWHGLWDARGRKMWDFCNLSTHLVRLWATSQTISAPLVSALALLSGPPLVPTLSGARGCPMGVLGGLGRVLEWVASPFGMRATPASSERPELVTPWDLGPPRARCRRFGLSWESCHGLWDARGRKLLDLITFL